MLISDLKLLLRFQTSSLYEEVSSTTMYSVGESPPQILPGGGYIMSNDQYLMGTGASGGGYNIGISDAFTFGFWLYSVNPGVATNPNGDAVSISMPVISLNEIGSGEDNTIEITENTTVDGENNLTVILNKGGYSASSEEYAPLKWHHFWIVYNGTTFSIYVDGIRQTLQNVEGTIPSIIKNSSMLDLYINHSVTGYAYNVAKNYGYISDIFLMNVASDSLSNIQRVVNDGIKYFVDDTYINLNIEKSSMYFNDPDTIIVTSSIDDMSYVYLGRNDGKILRGSPLFWETRITFSENGETDLLGLEAGDTWQMVDGFLELKNISVRL